MKIEKIINTSDTAVSFRGTSFQNEVICSFEDLVSLFGEPLYYEGRVGFQTDVAWIFILNTGEVVTLYNWKNGPNYLGIEELYDNQIQNIIEWNIGAKTSKPASYIKRVIEKRWESFPDIYKKMI